MKQTKLRVNKSNYTAIGNVIATATDIAGENLACKSFHSAEIDRDGSAVTFSVIVKDNPSKRFFDVIQVILSENGAAIESDVVVCNNLPTQEEILAFDAKLKAKEVESLVGGKVTVADNGEATVYMDGNALCSINSSDTERTSSISETIVAVFPRKLSYVSSNFLGASAQGGGSPSVVSIEFLGEG